MLKEFGYVVRTDNITSFPNNINSNSGSIIDYSISGDMVQKSENLVISIEKFTSYFKINVDNFKTLVDTCNTFTLTFTTDVSLSSNSIYLHTTTNKIIAVISGFGTLSKTLILSTEDINAIKNSTTPYLYVYKQDADFTNTTNVMLNKGTTVLPYVSYNPTPTYPITPIEVGDKTDNLFSISFTHDDYATNVYHYVLSGLIPNNNYTCSSNFIQSSASASIWFGGTDSATCGVSTGVTRTVKADVDGNIVMYINHIDGGAYSQIANGTTWLMVNEGTEPLPYEPYGYKININTNNIYLNEPLYGIGDYKDTIDVTNKTLTRKIKKLVLTGQENWVLRAEFQGATAYALQLSDLTVTYTVAECVCSHYKFLASYADVSDHIYQYVVDAGGFISVTDTTNLTLSNFKTYLTNQYTNGTPVIVYYVLATPTTENITIPSTLTNNIEGYLTQTGTPTPTNPIYPTYNGTLNKDNTYTITTNIGTDNIIYTSEPIRKIGDYSDTIGADGTVTRRFKKLVLTGNENWTNIGTNKIFNIQNLAPPVAAYRYQICSHFPLVNNWTSLVNTDNSFAITTTDNQLIIHYSQASSINNFKQFLANQYVARTPVTVWYVLATPTTDTTITTPPTINTIKGINTINNNNTLSPSNIRLKYNKGDWLETYYRQIDINNITSNTLPIYFNSDSNTIGSYNIKGDMNQSSTPTPTVPVYPNECGDRTENLFNVNTITTGYRIQWTTGNAYEDASAMMSDYILVSNGNYRVSSSCVVVGYDSSKTYVGVYRGDTHTWEKRMAADIVAFSVGSTDGISYIKLLSYGGMTIFSSTTMLIKGSTLPSTYEPYGYKIPIELNNIYINNPLYAIGTYIDSLDLSTGVVTRNIGKYVLNGGETWQLQSINSYGIANHYIRLDSPTKTSLCSHYQSQTTVIADTATEGYLFVANSGDSLGYFYIRSTIQTTSDFKTYLQQQYNSGTPVTIYYILATPTTETTTIQYTLTGTIDGYLIQDGTPTPSNPIYPISNGTETENLFNKDTIVTGGIASDGSIGTNNNIDVSDYILVRPNTTYTSTYLVTAYYGRAVGYYDSSKTFISASANNVTTTDGNSTFTFTTPNNCNYIRIASYTNITNHLNELILTEGSIPSEHYEPYGYKLPAYTTDIYTNEPIRKIGNYGDIINSDGTVSRYINKYVVTGNENYTITETSTTGLYCFAFKFVDIGMTDILDFDIPMTTCPYPQFVCSHFRMKVTPIGTDEYYNIGDGEIGGNSVRSQPLTYNRYFILCASGYSTIEAFRTYLQQQYQLGTPVTIYYILATPTTETITNPNLPLLIDENTLDINTKLKPSEVTIGAKQWVNKVPKIYINNKWTYNWTTFRELVRSGKAQDVFPVGTILYDTWGDDTSTAFQIVSYNTHYNTDLYNEGYTNSVTLCEEKVRYGVPFDSVEAMMYVTTAMPAGGYKFTIPNYDATYGGNKTYYFETTQEVPIGGQICLEWRYQTVPRTIRTYASNTSTTILDSYGTSSSPLPEWDSTTYPDAIDLGTVTLSTTATTGTYGIFNHIHRARYGSNNYLQSRIRQYMNGTTNWWTPQTIFDRPTDWNITTLPTNGLLNILNTDLTNILTTPTITTTANNTFEYQSLDGTTFTLNSSYTINTDKLFLLSHTEVNLSATPNSGTVLDYYINADNAKRIKYDITASSTARYWWFRTPRPSNATSTRYCTSPGALDYYVAYTGHGCVPACVIQ